MKNKICYGLMGSMLIVLIISSYVMAEHLTLIQWIEKALKENPGYQLMLKDHQLVLEELSIEKKGGPGKISFTLSPITISDQGLSNNYGIGVGYGWNLPNDLYINGGNNLSRNATGEINLTGDIGLSVNLMEFLKLKKNEELEQKYQAEEQRMFQVKATLVSNVVKNYFEILLTSKGVQIARLKAEEAQVLLEKKANQLKEGVISQLDYFEVEDQYKTLLTGYKDAEENLELARRDFSWIFGKVTMDKEMEEKLDLIQKSGSLILETTKINHFLENWDVKKVDQYLRDIPSYQEALFAVKSAEENIEEIKDIKDWDVTLATSLGYEIGEGVDFSATVGLSKTLYEPSLKRKLQQAEIELQRKILAFEEHKNQLIYDLVNRVQKIESLVFNLAEANMELEVTKEQKNRLAKQYESGYVSLKEVEKVELMILEKEMSIIELHSQLTTAKLALGQLLCFENFYK